MLSWDLLSSWSRSLTGWGFTHNSGISWNCDHCSGHSARPDGCHWTGLPPPNGRWWPGPAGGGILSCTTTSPVHTTTQYTPTHITPKHPSIITTNTNSSGVKPPHHHQYQHHKHHLHTYTQASLIQSVQCATKSTPSHRNLFTHCGLAPMSKILTPPIISTVWH